jgi:hypothetical protein
MQLVHLHLIRPLFFRSAAAQSPPSVLCAGLHAACLLLSARRRIRLLLRHPPGRSTAQVVATLLEQSVATPAHGCGIGGSNKDRTLRRDCTIWVCQGDSIAMGRSGI